MRWRILSALTADWQNTPAIAKSADLPTGSAKYQLDELVALKLVERLLKDEKDSSMDKRADSYRLSTEAEEAIRKLKTRISIEDNIST